ncbi:ATP-dependent metalloprotease FtsH [Caldithrix abyssi DSM 13497]|uniref:ATP-dependent zinc metalloprotease FtsH n=1 Tax=Caldithrix abyssi DSM 13497 TaxID=880073 RepID=H1XNZ9_CALAY|nr:ATP-dependent zinc metalloprotease FtsH [Caldithrix abyssi]APF20486.1 ftsH membrane protease FtsH catalytic subunit [Caldithrix abyssi DSM 13497]EHO40991.1 ATP-dependent metalloprotease FtsH [Caldithrix abyssi DSM 13497]
MENKNKNSDHKKQPQNNDEFQWKKASKTGLIWILILLAAIAFSTLWPDNRPNEVEVPYNEYMRLLRSKMIRSGEVTLKDNRFRGVLVDQTEVRSVNGGIRSARYIRTILPFVDSDVIKEWEENDVKISFVEPPNDWTILLINILPWILIIGVWVFFAKRMQGGGGGSRGIFNFGKSKAKLLTKDKINITFDDVAGCDEAKMELQEIIEFLKDPQKFTRLGGKIPKGALLLGPPGTGKTLLAKAVAGEAGVPFFSMSGADFVEMFVGVGASRVRDLFEIGRKNAPCIIFIDEIDAVGRHRGAGLGGGHDEREQTLNQLLVEMDGFDTQEGVILIAATNRPDVLDSALLRPGRFDRQIVVDRPDVRGREGILKVHTRKVPLDSSVDLEALARGTPGLSGADLANLVNEAALLAARKNRQKVTMADFEEAKDKIMMGMERKSILISEEEKKVTAYHESGHVLVGKLTPGTDPVHKVTIIPRGRALGVTAYLPLDERHTYSREYLEGMLTQLLGGRCAEKLVFEQLTTGAGNDIERATDLARKMVCEWGMSEKLGPITFGKKEQEIFLGREITQHRDYSERTAQEIDQEVRRIVREAEERAETLLKENIDKLHALAKALLEFEILDGEQIDLVLKGEKIKKQAFAAKDEDTMAKPRRRRKKKTPEAEAANLPQEESKAQPEQNENKDDSSSDSEDKKA